MKTVPDIVVQIVHIEGPLKGEVQEFSDSEIQIGRNSSCHVIFPKDQMTISRLHATIVREGNRFRIIDKSSNGTLVNGKFVTDQYIKDGDVIFITEQGPKISFLTRKPAEGEIVQKKAPEPKVAVSPVPLEKPPAGKKEMPVRETSVTLVIQYGTNLHSFKKLPVTVGKSPECNLMIDQPSICGQHAQFFSVKTNTGSRI